MRIIMIILKYIRWIINKLQISNLGKIIRIPKVVTRCGRESYNCSSYRFFLLSILELRTFLIFKFTKSMCYKNIQTNYKYKLFLEGVIIVYYWMFMFLKHIRLLKFDGISKWLYNKIWKWYKLIIVFWVEETQVISTSDMCATWDKWMSQAGCIPYSWIESNWISYE